jgi:MoxR-like ATPase
MGYMNRESEYEVMFDNESQLSIEDLGAVIEPEDVQRMIDYAVGIDVATDVGYYIVDLVQASRNDGAAALGGSPRATIALLRAARVLAASDGRDHVYPDDVRAVLPSIMAHRVILNPESILRGESVSAVLERITNSVKPPVSGRGRQRDLEAVGTAS